MEDLLGAGGIGAALALVGGLVWFFLFGRKPERSDKRPAKPKPDTKPLEEAAVAAEERAAEADEKAAAEVEEANAAAGNAAELAELANRRRRRDR